MKQLLLIPAALALATSLTSSSAFGAQDGVRHFTAEVAKWYQHVDRRIMLGDVLDPSNSSTMSVGYARYAPGQANEWVVTYDEVLIVTKGAYTVTAGDGTSVTAKPGEFIFLTKGTKVIYSAEEETEVIYVTYPHWMKAQEKSEHAGMLETFRPAD